MSEIMFLILESNARSILAAYEGVSVDGIRWKPAPDKWSLLEILAHLVDEERLDFRRRVSLTLEDPDQEWPPIDPGGWVDAHDYMSWDLDETLKTFAEERAASIEWLRGLTDPAWDNQRFHPIAGSLRAGDLLASWAAHDLLHLRQISNTKLAYVKKKARPYTTTYAAP